MKKILLVINIVVATLLVISYLSVGTSPERSLIYTFMPFIYVILLIINMIFVFLWVFIKWKFSCISLIAILIGIKLINLIFPFSSYINLEKNKEGDLKIMSYNVKVFGLYNWEKNLNIKSNILRIIGEEKPNIVCLQEAFWVDKASNFITIDSLKIILKTKYVHKSPMATAVGKQNFGLVTISDYPIINQYSHKFKNSFNGFIFTDIIISTDTVRVYNCHLQSIHFDENDYTLLETFNEKELNPEFKNLFKKYFKAYKKRANQSDIMKKSIDSCNYPVFICGDFNDIPISYTYLNIKNNLFDSFTARGKFSDYTWNNYKIKQRIDYILYSNKYNCISHKVIKKEYSDHYPVVSEFNIKNGN